MAVDSRTAFSIRRAIGRAAELIRGLQHHVQNLVGRIGDGGVELQDVDERPGALSNPCLNGTNQSDHLKFQSIGNGWIKRDRRRLVELPAIVISSDNNRIAGIVSNLSYDGCHIRCDHGLEVGEDFTLVLPTLGDIAARVRWTKKGGLGARFMKDPD